MTSEVLVSITEETSSGTHGYEPEKRPIDVYLNYGLIPLDKTRGPTSHEVVSWVRRLIGTDNAGHSGTLDPGVSGLLPIGLGRATKALSLYLLFPKEYIAVMRIHSSVARERVDVVLKEFTAEIFQKPPQRSAVKRQVRSRTIYEMEVLEQEGNLYLVRVLCEAGTYIRKLVYDVGEVLGVGATMVELRRTKVGPLTEEKGFVTLHDLNDAVFRWKAGDETRLRSLVRPIERCIDGVKKVVVKDAAIDAICHGAMLAVPGIVSLSSGISKGDTVILLSGKGELVAIAEAKMTTDEVSSSKKGIAFPVKRVIMERGTYPKLWRSGSSKDEHNENEDSPKTET